MRERGREEERKGVRIERGREGGREGGRRGGRKGYIQYLPTTPDFVTFHASLACGLISLSFIY